MELTSTAFGDGGEIPRKYSCDGADVSPPVSWRGVPSEASSLALICEDPDAPAGTWVHWVYCDIPVSVSELPEGMSTDERPPQGGVQGVNDFRRIGYGGPCPPGGEHRYYFKLYALDSKLGLEPRATKAELEAAMQGHVLTEAHLMGTYAR